ncbi:MAG: TIGR03619 family F420-dependent LLM class oxidoreductase [Deltaproteobacteria bacterium]|nr:TIGR03619 family F420-dependent LLM class oxidoreductase [Deltaproteobacteria bacterium]MBW2362839.1 TIGR03619 family F420-dependent LLM class oxidoreductase [Deltaproteobacteria bacterium]
MQLPVQSTSSIYAEAWELDADVDAIDAIARKADETGFFYLGVCDHTAIPRALQSAMGTQWYDTIATLGYLAGITRKVRLLSHVYVVAHRHPLLAAKSFMTLDELSRGRVILGVGVGHVESEFEVLEADFRHRGRDTDEAIQLIRKAFDQEYPEHQGRRWSVADAGLAPRPRQARIPIWVGGSSQPALRRAAELGDGWLPQQAGLQGLSDAIAALRERRKQALGAAPLDIGAITEPLYVGQPSWEIDGEVLSGSPEYIAERLREFGSFGANHLQVRFRNRSLSELLDQMEAFGSQVAPLLNG